MAILRHEFLSQVFNIFYIYIFIIKQDKFTQRIRGLEIC